MGSGRARRFTAINGLAVAVIAVGLLAPPALVAPSAEAHSEGEGCADRVPFPLLLNDAPLIGGLLGEFVHCHEGGGLEHHEFPYTGAVYVHAHGVAYAGFCTDREVPFPPEARIRPYVGLGDPDEQTLHPECGLLAHIKVEDFEFDPQSGTFPQGTTIRWKNDGPSQHTSTYVGELAVWDSGILEAQVWPEQSLEFFFVDEEDRRQDHIFEITLTQAGTYPYRSETHPHEPDLNATVSVAVAVEPSDGCRPRPCGRGTEHTTFTIGLATHDPPRGIVHDVEVRLDGGDWAPLKFGVRSATLDFQPDAGPGLYEVRSRVRRTGGGPPSQHPSTLWSPPAPIYVLATGSTASS